MKLKNHFISLFLGPLFFFHVFKSFFFFICNFPKIPKLCAFEDKGFEEFVHHFFLVLLKLVRQGFVYIFQDVHSWVDLQGIDLHDYWFFRIKFLFFMKKNKRINKRKEKKRVQGDLWISWSKKSFKKINTSNTFFFFFFFFFWLNEKKR